jgi:hypothetical protein
MKFGFISAHRETFNAARMFSLLNVTGYGYFCLVQAP